MADSVHRYRTNLHWEGSTAAGYHDYDRTHTLDAPPADATLALSADPAFHGDPTLLNPEQLLLAAASSCQMLSFLAIAARARIDVVRYTDHAEGTMPEDDKPMRITTITLRPEVVLRAPAGADADDDDGRRARDDRVKRLLDLAHKECFIASSLKSDIVVQPEIHWT